MWYGLEFFCFSRKLGRTEQVILTGAVFNQEEVRLICYLPDDTLLLCENVSHYLVELSHKPTIIFSVSHLLASFSLNL